MNKRSPEKSLQRLKLYQTIPSKNKKLLYFNLILSLVQGFSLIALIPAVFGMNAEGNSPQTCLVDRLLLIGYDVNWYKSLIIIAIFQSIINLLYMFLDR